MASTLNYALLRFGGPAYAGDEIWSCGLKLRHLGGDEQGAMNEEIVATIDDVTTAVQAYVNNALASFTSSVSLAWVRLNVIDKVTGDYAFPHDPHIVEFTPDPAPGGAGLPQVAYAVTCRGIFKRGPAAFGRWFVPAAISTGLNGRMSTTYQQNAANAAGSFLAALAAIDSGLGPDAWVPHLFGDGESGTRDSAIDSVSVGSVFDTQRRRRNQLVETYLESTTWPP